MTCGTNSDFAFYRGDNFDLKCTVKVSGVPHDITGAALIFSIKENPTDTTYIFQRKNADAGGSPSEIEMSDPTNGEFKIHVLPINTLNVPGDVNYWYDIQMTLSGTITTVKRGRVFIAQDITI